MVDDTLLDVDLRGAVESLRTWLQTRRGQPAPSITVEIDFAKFVGLARAIGPVEGEAMRRQFDDFLDRLQWEEENLGAASRLVADNLLTSETITRESPDRIARACRYTARIVLQRLLRTVMVTFGPSLLPPAMREAAVTAASPPDAGYPVAELYEAGTSDRSALLDLQVAGQHPLFARVWVPKTALPGQGPEVLDRQLGPEDPNRAVLLLFWNTTVAPAIAADLAMDATRQGLWLADLKWASVRRVDFQRIGPA